MSEIRDATRTVVVTGAAGALGRAVIADFAAAGMRVIALGRPEALHRLDPALNATRLPVDLLDEADVQHAILQAVELAGRLDALICLAGGFFGDTALLDTIPQRLEDQFALNVMTAYNSVYAVLPHLLAGGGGAIVGVSSRPAVRPVAGAVAYAIAKLGVVKLMEQVAAEYREQGIRANAIIPSIIDTPENRAAMPDADVERWVRPEQIAAVLRFLVGDEASIISGAAIPVYGRA